MPPTRNTLSSNLRSLGIPEDDVGRRISILVFPLRFRVYSRLRHMAGGKLFTLERKLVEDLAGCAEWTDIEDELFAYHTHSYREGPGFLNAPSRMRSVSQISKRYMKLKASWEGKGDPGKVGVARLN